MLLRLLNTRKKVKPMTKRQLVEFLLSKVNDNDLTEDQLEVMLVNELNRLAKAA